MHDDRGATNLESHIRAAACSEAEALALTDRLLRHCWPGGVADRAEPVARGWLCMWGPVKVIAAVPRCGCDSGRCTICN